MKTHLLLSTLALAGFSNLAHGQAINAIPWNHSWKFVHPMGAMPANAGNFADTWYLPDAQYDSAITFGAVPRMSGVVATTTSYDSGIAPAPLGYGSIDYVTNNAATAKFGQIAAASQLTAPSSGSRYTAYYKTTFTIPAGGANTPKLEFLCDDGGFVYLDGTLVASINMTQTEGYTNIATNATETETDIYVLDLSVAGQRSLPGTVLATRLMPVNVPNAIPFLAAGDHTLAVSVHNSSATSSDSAFAARLTGTGVCSFTTTSTSLTRDPNGTPGVPGDDTISAEITITAGTGNAATWNVTSDAPGAATNVTTGAYGTTHTFTFPVSTLVSGAATLTFADANVPACTQAVVLTAPGPPYILGQKRINGVEFPLYSALAMPTAWRSTTQGVFTNNGTGGNRTTQEFRSETIDLTGLPRPVTVVATFRANETSAGSNFEAADNFSAEIIEDGGAPKSMMATELDRGDGASSHVAVDGAAQDNGAPNGWLNGYTQIAPIDPNEVQTAIENYNANIIRDEFNWPTPDPMAVPPQPQPVLAAANLDRTFEISYPVPDTVNSIVLSFRGGCDSTSEFFTLNGVRVYNGACDMQATATGVVRGIGANATDPSDDILSFNLLITGNGSAWTYGAFSGNYGTAVAVTLPVSQSSILQTVNDNTAPGCISTFTVTAPQANLVVTATTPQGTTFATATAGGAAQNYTRPDGGTELGWTGGDADVRAMKQPDPNTTAHYLNLNGKTPAGDFLTEAVVIDPALEYLRVSLDLGAYTTSGTAFEDDDSLAIVVETSNDPAFPAAPAGATVLHPFYGAYPTLTANGVEFYNAFKVTSPDALSFGSAAVPFPEAPFTLHRRSIVLARGTHQYIRVRIAGGPSAAGSEYAIVDNILIEEGTCELTATPVITRDNKGDDDLANDEFSASVTVNAVANGGSTGWLRVGEGSPTDGLYAAPVTFGPYLVSGGPVSVRVADNVDAACTLDLTFAPPVCALTIEAASVDSTVQRNNNSTTATVNDDSITFDVTVTATNGGTGWTSNIPNPSVAGTFYSGTYGNAATVVTPYTTLPVPVIFRDAADPACTVNYTVPVPHEEIFNLGTLVPLTGAPQPIPSLAVPPPANTAAATWTNPADGVVAMDNPVVTPAPDPAIYTVNSSIIPNPEGFKEILFTADLVVRETSNGSNFEAADRFRILITYELAGGGTEVRNAVAAYDANNDGFMNGQDDTAGSYNANPTGDEFNRPAPGVNLAGSISHTFALSAIIPAGATSISYSIEGYNNSATEHYRVENILLTERLEDPNADADGDGVSNKDEDIMGTLKNDPASVTRLASTTNPNQFTFEGVAGRFYRVYMSEDTAAPTHLTVWKDAGLGSLSGAGTKTVTITQEAGVPRRFYRLHVRESNEDWPAVVPSM